MERRSRERVSASQRTQSAVSAGMITDVCACQRRPISLPDVAGQTEAFRRDARRCPVPARAAPSAGRPRPVWAAVVAGLSSKCHVIPIPAPALDPPPHSRRVCRPQRRTGHGQHDTHPRRTSDRDGSVPGHPRTQHAPYHKLCTQSPQYELPRGHSCGSKTACGNPPIPRHRPRPQRTRGSASASPAPPATAAELCTRLPLDRLHLAAADMAGVERTRRRADREPCVFGVGDWERTSRPRKVVLRNAAPLSCRHSCHDSLPERCQFWSFARVSISCR